MAKKTKKDDESQLNPDERERRRVQKELRDLALKLRKTGQDYKPQKHKRKLFIEKGAGKARREKKKEKTAQKTAIRVVVLPIFWEERSEEMQSVLAAAKKVHELLSSGLGPSCRIVTDNNNKFKPGPRMKHWETLGVPVRIEIGPQDVAKGNCVVARATGEPGTVAEKSTMKMSKALVKHVRQALSDAGVKLGKAEGASTSDPADDEGDGQHAHFSSDDDDDNDDKETVGGIDKPLRTIMVPAGDLGGDDMDDFNIEAEWVGPEEQGLTMTKKEKAKMKRQDDKAKKRKAAEAAKGTVAVEVEDANVLKQQKKQKVVVF